jgi:alpha-1,6-mannosyltransferase
VLGFLPRYLREEGLLSGGRYYLLDLFDRILDWLGVVHGLPAGVFTALVLAALGIVLVWAFLRNPSLSVSRPDQHLCWLHSGFVLALFFSVILSSYPWYYAWVVLFLCFVPNAAALGLTLSLTQLYRSSPEAPGRLDGKRSGPNLLRRIRSIGLPGGTHSVESDSCKMTPS